MKSDDLYLRHIRDAIQKIEQYTALGAEEFFRSPMMQDAVIRNLEVIGEATKRPSESLRSASSSIPWSRIAGMRDVLIHHYLGVKIETVWTTCEERLPELKAEVARLLAEPPQ